jgi:hypothetical protein
MEPIRTKRTEIDMMTRPPRNPRWAYDADGHEIRPMSLGNMREHGVRSVLAICQRTSCGRAASINVDELPDDFPVPDVSLRLRCSKCGSRQVKTQPDRDRADGRRNMGTAAKDGLDEWENPRLA